MEASQAQVRFLEAWNRSHPAELRETMANHDAAGIPFADMEMPQASAVISEMVAKYNKPKKGDDQDGNGKPKTKISGEDDGIGDGGRQGDGQNGENGSGDGEGQGDGQQQGQGEGQGQEGGSGDGDGDGDGEGDGQNDNDNGGEMENPYREGSKEQIIAQALIDNNMERIAAYNQIKDQIGQKPLEFMGNVGGGRAPLPLGEDNDKSNERTQKGRAKKTINDVRNALIDKNGDKNRIGEKHQQGNDDQQQDGQQDGNGNGNGQGRQMYEAEMLLEQINAAREICQRMNADGEPFDTVGLRPYVYGSKMLGGGMPRMAIIDAMTMTWPKEVRRELNDGKNLPEFDQRKFAKSKSIPAMPLDEIEAKLAPLSKKTTGKSLYLPAMVSLAKAGVPILQVGEKGTGKTTNAEHLAQALTEEFGRPMPFGFASMTSGTSPGEFKGRITLEGFLPSLFEDIYQNGGVFLFDELDAGDENLLTLLNSALANGYFVNQKGEVIHMSEHFIPVAAANTMGLGANGRYTGRNRLDAATLDRWAMGRMKVEFDQHLAEFLYWSEVKAYEEATLS